MADMTPEIRKRVIGGILAASAVAGAVGGYAVTRGQDQSRPVGTDRPSAAAASPTPKETATPTVKPTETTKPTEIPAVDCKIFPEQSCSQMKRTMLDINGVKVEYLVGNLPAGTPITAPIDGHLFKAQESGNLAGFVVQIVGDSGGAAVRGDIRLDNMIQKDVKAGDIVGYVGNTGVKIGKDSNFNIATTLIKITNAGSVVDEDALKKLFPKAFEKQ